MTAANWIACSKVTLSYEGGNDDDPRDPGGRTSRGITQREYNRWRATHPGLADDVWRAPQQTIVDIYHTEYWNRCDGDAWPVGVDLCVYDASVNSGIGKGLSWARAALAQSTGTFQSLALAATAFRDKVAIIHRYQARRLSFLHALRTWAYFGRGWGRRVAGIEAIATRWALGVAGMPTQPHLREQAQSSKGKAKAARNSAAATPAVPVAHVATSHHYGWLDYALTGVIVVAGLLVVAYLLHTWYVHTARARAFLEEADA